MFERIFCDVVLRLSWLGVLVLKILFIEFDGVVFFGGWVDSLVFVDKVDNYGWRFYFLLELEDNFGDRSKESYFRGYLIRRDVDWYEFVVIFYVEYDGVGDVIGEFEGLVVNVLRVCVDIGFGLVLDVVCLFSFNIFGFSGVCDFGYCVILVSYFEIMLKWLMRVVWVVFVLFFLLKVIVDVLILYLLVYVMVIVGWILFF